MAAKRRLRTKLETTFDRLTAYQYWLQGFGSDMIIKEMHKLHKESNRRHAPLSERTVYRDLQTAKDEVANSEAFNLSFELRKKYDEYELIKKELWRIIREGVKNTSVTGKQETRLVKGQKVKVVVPQLQQDTIYKNGGLAPYFAQLRGVIKDQSKLIGIDGGSSFSINILNQIFGTGEDKEDSTPKNNFDELPYHKQEAIMEILLKQEGDFEDAEVIEE